MVHHFRNIFIFVLVIVSMKFFEARFFPGDLTTYIQFFGILGSIAISIPYVFAKRAGFVFPVQLLFFSILLSGLMAKIFWDQGITDTIKATLPYLLWIFFFYLLSAKIPTTTIEKIVIIYGVIFILVYFFQLANSDSVMFGGKEVFRKERGITRVMIPGSGIFLLASFISLNKFSNETKGRWKWIPLMLLGLIFPFLIATRQLIATILFIYILHFTKKIDLVKRAVILGSFVAVFLILSAVEHPVFDGLKSVQKQTLEEGSENIRILAGTYFMTKFSPNTINRIFGNGVPYGHKSDYGKFVTNLNETKYFYLSDVGLIALYAMFGILPIIAYIIIWTKSLTIKVPKEFYYLKYYLWYLLFTCLASATVYDVNQIMTTIFVLYIYQTISTKEKNKHQLLKVLRRYAENDLSTNDNNISKPIT